MAVETEIERIDFSPAWSTIEINVTSTLVISLPVTEGGVPVDLTGYTVTFGVYSDDAFATSVEDAAITGTTARTATITPVQHASIGVGESYWRFDVISPSGVATRVKHGVYLVKG